MTNEPQIAEPGSALDILTNAPELVDDRLIVLSNGVRLRARPVPRSAIRRAVTAVPDPEVPIATLSDGRQEPNPADPDYAAAWQATHLARITAATRCMVALGLEIDTLPEGFPPPASDEWIEELEVAGITARRTPRAARWFDWVDLYTVRTEADTIRLFWTCQAVSGTMEAEVAEAMRYFQSLAQR